MIVVWRKCFQWLKRRLALVLQHENTRQGWQEPTLVVAEIKSYESVWVIKAQVRTPLRSQYISVSDLEWAKWASRVFALLLGDPDRSCSTFGREVTPETEIQMGCELPPLTHSQLSYGSLRVSIGDTGDWWSAWAGLTKSQRLLV